MVDGWKALQFSRAAQDGDRGGGDVANDGDEGGGGAQQVDKDARQGGEVECRLTKRRRSVGQRGGHSEWARKRILIGSVAGRTAQIYAKYFQNYVKLSKSEVFWSQILGNHTRETFIVKCPISYFHWLADNKGIGASSFSSYVHPVEAHLNE